MDDSADPQPPADNPNGFAGPVESVYQEPEWFEDPPVHIPMPVEHKDEYHERIFQYLSEAYGWGHSSQHLAPTVERPFGRLLELLANDEGGQRSTRFWIINVDDGLLTFVVGQGKPDEVEIEQWRTASDVALTRLGSRSPVKWRAYFASGPSALPGARLSLKETQTLEDETAMCSPPGLMSSDVMGSVGQILATPHFSSLIRVDGSTGCWAWHGDGEAATIRRLRLLAALLSVWSGEPWFLRDGPTDRPEVSWADSPGPVSGHHYRWTEEPDHIFQPQPTSLPAWFAAADAAVRSGASSAKTQRALLMHHEGQLIMREHPSLALLSFVASIETLAVHEERPQRCPTCNMVTGSTQRFNRAVEGVLPVHEAAMLSTAYGRRSRTVHDSHLHGREANSGAWGEISLYKADTSMFFEVAVVGTAQKASRAMLLNALGVDDSH